MSEPVIPEVDGEQPHAALPVSDVPAAVSCYTKLGVRLGSASASTISRPRPSWLTWYSVVTVTAAVAAPFALISAGVASPGDVGLFQRISLGVLNAWMLVCASLMLVRQ